MPNTGLGSHPSIMGILYHSFMSQKPEGGLQRLLVMKQWELRWTSQFKFHSLPFYNWMKLRLQRLFQNLFFKYNKIVWADISFLLVLTFCIWLSTNLQRINHSTNPMDLVRAWSVSKGNGGRGGDLKPTPLGQCVLGGKWATEQTIFSFSGFTFFTRPHENTLTKQRTQN